MLEHVLVELEQTEEKSTEADGSYRVFYLSFIE